MVNKEAGDEENTKWTHLYGLGEPHPRTISPQSSSINFPSKEEEGKADAKEQAAESRDGPKLLPFEFVALEACLEAACSCLENEARTLEREAHPALDKLTSKISTLNLDRVRQIKSRLVAISGRVQKIFEVNHFCKDELENLLDDDDDMAEMYLTDKLQQQLDGFSNLPSSFKTVRMKMTLAKTLMDGNESSHVCDDPTVLSKDSADDAHTNSTRSSLSKQLDVESLKCSWKHILFRLTLREYVDDTEDYINIMLDDKQNHLLQMGVMLTTATLVLSVLLTVAGVFGMNIKIDMFNDKEHGMTRFLWTVGAGSAGTFSSMCLPLHGINTDGC
ncbi:Magnesium transporter MRS2-3 [Sesamum angolense]|uniref:Magnesium transporter MRS2-3 n=1 Tax=Sesamum angolense TaxID=2727404 RepID=A0AAE1WNU0_9LAMI|nr:Magnesium transporter MRS2-3 [Sesamum angolense]